MISLEVKIRIFSLCLVFFLLAACTKKKVPLDEKQFTAFLIDMHRADGTVNVARNLTGLDDKRTYTYYNEVFDKYGITRSDFDSCMHYYSAQRDLFSKMYDVVIDSLNKQLTSIDVILNKLKANDSLNLFPRPDTLVLDSNHLVYNFEVDSIVPGLYKFATTIRFDSVDSGKKNRIVSYFLSDDLQDTLVVREIKVQSDTIERTYNWMQYVDTIYDKLVIRMVEADNVDKLKQRQGKIMNTTLFRPYISATMEKRLRMSLPPKKKEK